MEHAPQSDATTTRVLTLFSLTVPAIIFFLVTYVALTEHVFGMSYVIGRRLGRRLRAGFRVAYLLIASVVAGLFHAALLLRCTLDEFSLCPAVLLGERRCLAPSASACLAVVVAISLERVFVPMLDLWRVTPYEHGTYSRAVNGAAVAVVWFCMAEEQLGAILLLCMLSSRRALALLPRCNKLYGIFIKLYTVLHMSRVLAHRCGGSRRLVVASTVSMLSL